MRAQAGSAVAVLVGAGISLLCAFVYLPTLGHEFVVIDDLAYLVEPAHLKEGLTASNVRWALTTFHQSNWHPATWISYLLEAQLFGLTPRVVHAGNALLHAGNALLLFALLRALTGSLWRGAAVAALFAVHPLRVESVAWAAERKDVLSAALFLGCCLAYVRYARRPGWARLLPVLLVFALGLMAKPMLVTLPFVLLLLDFWPLGRMPAGAGPGCRRRWQHLLVEKLPLLALSAGASAVTFVAQRRGGAIAALEGYPLLSRLGDAVEACGFYLGKTFWPTRLAVFYPHAATRDLLAFGLGAAAALAGTALAVTAWRSRPHLAVGWFWFLGMLVPVIGLVQVGAQAYADRYAYLPQAGLLVALVWEGARLAGVRATARGGVALAVCAAALVLALVARGQVGFWRDDDALFGHAKAVTSENYLAYHNHGSSLALRGRPAEAIEQYEQALRIRPDSWKTAYGLGWALAAVGRREEAVVAYERALRLRPGLPQALQALSLLRAVPPPQR